MKHVSFIYTGQFENNDSLMMVISITYTIVIFGGLSLDADRKKHVKGSSDIGFVALSLHNERTNLRVSAVDPKYSNEPRKLKCY